MLTFLIFIPINSLQLRPSGSFIFEINANYILIFNCNFFFHSHELTAVAAIRQRAVAPLDAPFLCEGRRHAHQRPLQHAPGERAAAHRHGGRRPLWNVQKDKCLENIKSINDNNKKFSGKILFKNYNLKVFLVEVNTEKNSCFPHRSVQSSNCNPGTMTGHYSYHNTCENAPIN